MMTERSLSSPRLDDIPPIAGDAPRVAVLASGSGSNFEAIAAAVQGGDLGVELCCLVCNNPGAEALKRAERLGVAPALIDHRGFAERARFEREVLSALAHHGADWVVMAGWMRLMSEDFVEAYRGRMLNIHPSLLPAFRGLDAVGQALAAGVRITGVTVHHVVPEMDAGPIVAQVALPVLDADDRARLHARLQAQEHALYPRAIALAINASRGRAAHDPSST